MQVRVRGYKLLSAVGLYTYNITPSGTRERHLHQLRVYISSTVYKGYAYLRMRNVLTFIYCDVVVHLSGKCILSFTFTVGKVSSGKGRVHPPMYIMGCTHVRG